MRGVRSTPMADPDGARHRRSATLLGVFSILFWGTVIAFSRGLIEQLGTFTAGAAVFLAGGVLSVAVFGLKHRGWKRIGEASGKYLWLCGALFVLYEILFTMAIGWSTSRAQVLEIGLINYLWIGFTLLFSVPILKRPARWPLVLGMGVALTGVALALLPPGFSFSEMVERIQRDGWPYALALGGAVAWALYSNLSRRWAPGPGVSGVPFFILVSGLALLVVRAFVQERSHWSWSALWVFAYMAVFPTSLGYLFWDQAMRRGDLVLVTSLSFLIPLLSTLTSSLILGVPMTAHLWLACLLVIGGAVLGERSLRGADFHN